MLNFQPYSDNYGLQGHTSQPMEKAKYAEEIHYCFNSGMVTATIFSWHSGLQGPIIIVMCDDLIYS